MACCILYCQRDINIGGLKTTIWGSDLGGGPKIMGDLHHAFGGLDKSLLLL
jgi:hypothetical protein